MKKKQFVYLILLQILFTEGCVQQPIEGGLSVPQNSDRAHQSAKIHTELAAEYFHRGQLEVAIEEVTEALRASSNYAPAYNMLGLINMTLNDDVKAQSSFERALKISPKDSEIHNNYGWFLCQRFPDRINQAIQHFMTATKDSLYSTPEKSYTNAGICELKRENYSAATTFFQQALTVQTNYPSALIGLIEIDFRKGNLQEAKSKLSRHMQRAPLTPEGLWLAIQIERALGDRLAEDSYIHQLQKHFPDSKEATAVRRSAFK